MTIRRRLENVSSESPQIDEFNGCTDLARPGLRGPCCFFTFWKILSFQVLLLRSLQELIDLRIR